MFNHFSLAKAPLYFLMLLFMFSIMPIQQAHSEDRTMVLPAPDKKGGKPLMQAMAERKVVRTLSDAEISNQDLSNILWAAWGVSRSDGKRTIPTARNKQNVSLYLSMKGFLWIYDATEHVLHKITEVDLSSVMKGPVMLIITSEAGDAKSDAYGNMHAGSIYQNVGLYCASAGLGNVMHAQGVEKVQEAIAQYLPSKYIVNILQSLGKIK